MNKAKLAKDLGAFNAKTSELTRRIDAGPCSVNMFDDERAAITAAMAWSKLTDARRGMYTVVHGPSAQGLRYFVCHGDGGMIHMSERLIGQYENGRRTL